MDGVLVERNSALFSPTRLWKRPHKLSSVWVSKQSQVRSEGRGAECRMRRLVEAQRKGKMHNTREVIYSALPPPLKIELISRRRVMEQESCEPRASKNAQSVLHL